jgi:predicted RNase H-like HicB family nuclease
VNLLEDNKLQTHRSFTIRVKKDLDSGWYAVQCVELPEAISQGKTESEALANIKEAIELVLEEREAEARKQGGRLTQINV